MELSKKIYDEQKKYMMSKKSLNMWIAEKTKWGFDPQDMQAKHANVETKQFWENMFLQTSSPPVEIIVHF